MTKGVNFQREQDYCLVKAAADNCVADGGDTNCWVGFVIKWKPFTPSTSDTIIFSNSVANP
jgi:hypothetical protein